MTLLEYTSIQVLIGFIAGAGVGFVLGIVLALKSTKQKPLK